MRQVWALALLAAIGCGHSITYTALNTSPHPLASRDPATVEVFTTGLPRRPFVEIGLFEIEQMSPASAGTPAMIGKLRSRAASIGCDALVITESTDRIQSVSNQSQGVSSRSSSGHSYYSGTTTSSVNHVRGHRAACVVYKEPASSSAPAPEPGPGAGPTIGL